MKQVRFAPAFDGLCGAKQGGGLNACHGAASRKRHGDGGGRDTVGEFGDHQEVIIPGGEKGGMNGPAEILDGNADRVEAILGVANQGVPSVCGVADLMAIIRHLTLLSQLGRHGGQANMRVSEEGVKIKSVHMTQR